MGCIIKYKGQSISEEQFLQYLNKQIAINNLFNENESLANEVYEAAGIPKVRLYRVYNSSAKGVVIEGQEKYTGQWFTTDLNYALSYVEKNKKVIKGQNVLDNKYDYSDLKVDVVELNPSEAKKYLLSQETVLKEKLDAEPDNFIIPSTITRSATINIGKEIGISNKVIKSFLPSEKDVFKKNIPLPTTSKFENLLQLEQQAQQLYSQYLDTIGVTQIGYHHSETDLDSFKTFSEGYFPNALKKKGTHYKEADDVVFFVKKPLTEEFMSQRKFTGTWGLKIPNTLQFNGGEKVGDGVHPGIDEGVKTAIDGNYDAVDFGRIRDNKTWSEVIAVTNPNNAIKLGSKQDIEGFQKFINKNPKNNNQELEWQTNEIKLKTKYPEITYEDFVSLTDKERENLISCL